MNALARPPGAPCPGGSSRPPMNRSARHPGEMKKMTDAEPKFDAEWIRQSARESAEVIERCGMGGTAGLGSVDELPTEGSFGPEEVMEMLGAWVARANRHHQFFTPDFIAGLLPTEGDGDDDEKQESAPVDLDVPTGSVVDGVGVLVVPGIKLPDSNSAGAKTYAAALDATLRDLSPNVVGWVLDFASHHTGGNVYPMLAGFAGLLGPGRLCGFADADGQRFIEATDSHIVIEGEVQAAIPDGSLLPPRPIAVMVGDGTTSAGEFTVLSLRHKARARLFGAPSAGYLSSVELEPLPSGGYLGVTTSAAVDVAGDLVGEQLLPDHACEPADFSTAISWVRTQATTE